MRTEDAVALAGSFLYHCIEDTVQENISENDGVNFEKFLMELKKVRSQKNIMTIHL